MVLGLFFCGFDAKQFGARPLAGFLARLADAFANLNSASAPVAEFLGGIFRVQRFLLWCVGHRRFCCFLSLFFLVCWSFVLSDDLQIIFCVHFFDRKIQNPDPTDLAI